MTLLSLSGGFTENIKDQLKNELNKIMTACDLTKMEITGVKLYVPKFETSKIEYNKRMWEEIAKLSINLYMDYDHYSKFLFKSEYTIKEYESRLIEIGLSIDNYVWKSDRMPNLKDVQLNMFMYFLWRVIGDNALEGDNEKNERILLMSLVNQEKNEDVSNCRNDGRTMNDSTVSIDQRDPNGDTIDINVEGYVYNISQFAVNIPLQVILSNNEADNNDLCSRNIDTNIDKTDEELVIGPHTSALAIEEGQQEKQSNEQVAGSISDNKDNMNQKRINNWECGRCTLLNNYTLGNCMACCASFEDGEWTCGFCKKNNSCTNDKCCQCDTSHVEFTNYLKKIECQDFTANGSLLSEDTSDAIGTNESNDDGILEDQWKCGICQLRQPYNNIACGGCGWNRIDMGIWKCHNCTKFNKCDCERCDTCEFWSKYLPEKYCQDCIMRRVVRAEELCEVCAKNIGWKCRCGTMNKAIQEYCAKCRLWRHNRLDRGVECQLLTDNGVQSVWVCSKCNSVNDLTRPTCWWLLCRAERYKPKSSDN